MKAETRRRPHRGASGRQELLEVVGGGAYICPSSGAGHESRPDGRNGDDATVLERGPANRDRPRGESSTRRRGAHLSGESKVSRLLRKEQTGRPREARAGARREVARSLRRQRTSREHARLTEAGRWSSSFTSPRTRDSRSFCCNPRSRERGVPSRDGTCWSAVAPRIRRPRGRSDRKVATTSPGGEGSHSSSSRC
jgi:hypothetical protein